MSPEEPKSGPKNEEKPWKSRGETGPATAWKNARRLLIPHLPWAQTNGSSPETLQDESSISQSNLRSTAQVSPRRVSQAPGPPQDFPSVPALEELPEEYHKVDKTCVKMGDRVNVKTNLGFERVIVKCKHPNGKIDIEFDDGNVLQEVMPRAYFHDGPTEQLLPAGRDPIVGDIAEIQTNQGWERITVRQKHYNGTVNIEFNDGFMMYDVKPRRLRPMLTAPEETLAKEKTDSHDQPRGRVSETGTVRKSLFGEAGLSCAMSEWALDPEEAALLQDALSHRDAAVSALNLSHMCIPPCVPMCAFCSRIVIGTRNALGNTTGSKTPKTPKGGKGP